MSSVLDTPTRSTSALAAPIQAAEEPSAGNPRTTLSIAASGTALVMAVFSAFVVNVGDSVHTFHAGVSGEAWGLSGMSLGLAGALLTAGALADDLGHGRVLRFSAALLAAASAVGAVAPSMEILVSARVLQGVAGGGILAAGLGSIGRAFPSGPARTRSTSVWGAAVGAGVMAGPLGAAALSAVTGWRGGFWVEAAAAAALAAAAARLTDSRATERRSLDLPGVATLAAAMTLLTAALVETRHGWSATTTLVLMGAATLMLGAFAGVELRSRRPMLDPHLLIQPRFLTSISGALFTGLAIVGLMSYAPALMQQALHISVLGSAAVLAAWSATSMVVALGAGALPSRLTARTRLLIGLALAAVGELSLTGLGTDSTWTRLVPGLVVTGLGSGIGNAALGRIAVESVPAARVGMGSGANNTARYLGGAAGAALIVSLASAGGPQRLIDGWNTAALVSAGLSAVGVAALASCRTWRRRDAPEIRHMTGCGRTGAFADPARETVVLGDGTRIAFRQLGAQDRDGFSHLFAHLGPESRRRRFLSPKPELTPRELTFFTDIDHRNHEAIAAVNGRDNSIVGVARYVRLTDRASAAEMAVEVADAFQEMGIGTALASLIVEQARANGMSSLTATTLWENSAARSLLRRQGFRARGSRGGQIEHELRLDELARMASGTPPSATGSSRLAHPHRRRAVANQVSDALCGC